MHNTIRVARCWATRLFLCCTLDTAMEVRRFSSGSFVALTRASDLLVAPLGADLMGVVTLGCGVCLRP